MSELDKELRDMLTQRADQVPTQHEMPRTVARRARRRIAVNAVGLSVVVVLLAGGAFAGVRAIQNRASKPGTGFSHSPSATPAPGPAACTSAQLRAVGSLQGAAGSREGSIRLTNLSNKTCILRGTPKITLLDGNLHAITSGVRFSASPPGWKANGTAQPAGWPVVTLKPYAAAAVRIRWSNWCPQGRSAPLWKVAIPGGGTVNANGMEATPPPPCNGPGQPSTIEVGPFEPTSSR